MKSSLMVQGDTRCARQKGNPLKLKKKKRRRVRRKTDVRDDKEIAAHMSHWDTFAIKVLWGRIKALWICVCNPVEVCVCIYVGFCIFNLLSILYFQCIE